jgi:nucleotide-binding universal stress UspA family protein
MFKRVLVPLDGSPLAEDALPYARQIVAPQGKLYLLSVVNVSETTFFPTPKNVDKIDHVLVQAHTYLENTAAQGIEDTFQTDIEAQMGDPAHVIVETARQQDIDVIVMSTHGHSGISRVLFGSIARKVLSESPCPVFIVPSHTRHAVPSQPEP